MKNAFSYNLATSPVITKTNTSVRNWMSSPVITVDSYTRLTDAKRVMNSNNIRMLPIVDEGKLVGIVTRRDLLRHDPSAMMKSNWDQYIGIGGQASRVHHDQKCCHHQSGRINCPGSAGYARE